jgi:hypothetical protein
MKQDIQFILTDFSQLLLTYTIYMDRINNLVSISNASRNHFMTLFFCNILSINTEIKTNQSNCLHWFYLITAICFEQLTALGIRYADHVTPSIFKSWH